MSLGYLNKKIGVLLLLLFSFVYPAVLFADQNLLKVGKETVSEQDLVYLLSRMTDNNLGVAVLALDGLNSAQKNALLEHVKDVLVLAAAAETHGLALSPSVERQIRWDRVNTLAEAYVARVSSKWDLSDKKLKEYYKGHRDRYTRPIRALVRIQKCPDFNSAKKVLDGFWSENTSKWVNDRNVPLEVSNLLFTSSSLGRMAPIKTFDGVYAVEVLRYEGQTEAPFSLVRNRIIEDLQKEYLALEIRKLKQKKEVTN